ncbi:MAG TPA: polysaccharide biosynthesis protein [Clostridiaceae bacterium]|nr:polysaccharide biosynthesis protein [Clostridiaceae bacterium]
MYIKARKLLLAISDMILLNLASIFALLLRFDGNIPEPYISLFVSNFIIITLIKITIFYIFGLYKSLWQYASITEALNVFMASLLSNFVVYIFSSLLDRDFPLVVYIIDTLLLLLFVIGTRFGYRILRRINKTYFFHKPAKTRVMIIGAGDAGNMVIRELNNHPELGFLPVVVIDDDKKKHGSSINGVPIKGDRTKIKEIVHSMSIDEIIIAMPSASKKDIRDILHICKQTNCKLKTLPGVYEIINGVVNISNIREVSIEDLLSRDEVKLNTEEIAGYLTNEVVLVTGGGGSIGSELCRQIVKYNPKTLLILDIYENNAYELQNELLYKSKNTIDLKVLIGSVRDKQRLEQIFEKYRPGVVFHAAAHKHVPLMEDNPTEAIKNNVLGTLYTAECADRYGVKKFVLISSDKAVNPTNVMGATKRMAEMIIQSLDKNSKTEFAAVRFGNVLGSNGSVVPLFKKQIEQGGPVTVTHPDVIRYFMTIPEAAQLVIQAGAIAKGGEVFILDMGEPVKIVDLARDLIRLSGFVPDEDIKIQFTGLRPGEKLYEEMLMAEENLRKTKHEKIFIAKPLDLSFNEVLLCVKLLENSLNDQSSIRENIAKVIPTYCYNNNDAVSAK